MQKTKKLMVAAGLAVFGLVGAATAAAETTAFNVPVSRLSRVVVNSHKPDAAKEMPAVVIGVRGAEINKINEAIKQFNDAGVAVFTFYWMGDTSNVSQRESELNVLFRALRERPGIDRSKVYLAGFGSAASIIAEALRNDPAVAGGFLFDTAPEQVAAAASGIKQPIVGLETGGNGVKEASIRIAQR